MSKNTVKEILPGDWIIALDGCTVLEAIEHLKTLPGHAMLDQEWSGYEDNEGVISVTRLETDVEYAHRIEYQELQKQFAQQRADSAKRSDLENIEKAIADLEKKKQVVLRRK